MRPVGIVDCETVDLLTYRLEKSVAASCKHANKRCVSSSGSGSDTYFIQSWCPDCKATVTEELTGAQMDREEEEWAKGRGR